MNANRHTHEHELRTFGNFVVDLEQIGFFQCFETKVIKIKITCVNNGPIQYIFVLNTNVVDFLTDEGSWLTGLRMLVMVKEFAQIGKFGDGHFVQIRNGDACGQDRVIGMQRGHVGSRFGRESVEEWGGREGVVV